MLPLSKSLCLSSSVIPSALLICSLAFSCRSWKADFFGGGAVFFGRSGLSSYFPSRILVKDLS